MLNAENKVISQKRLGFKKSFVKLNFKNLLKSTQTSLFKSIREFCTNSTLHGLSYLANKELCFFERAFFAISFLFVVIMATFFINNVYNKWCTTPIIFSINPKTTHIKNDPFPAVTICNINQAYKPNVLKLENNSNAYAVMQMLCKNDVNVTVAQNIKDWSFLNDFITNISQPCEKMLLNCHYGGKKYNCNDLFHPIITDEGLCCSFNMVHPKYMYKNSFLKGKSSINKTQLGIPVPWTADKGYPLNLTKHVYPYKAVGIGMSLGLQVILNIETDEYYCSTSSSFGLKIVLHSPTEEPCIKEVGLTITPGFDVKGRVQIKRLQSDPMLRHVAVKHRQCLFQGEDDLHYFTSYSHGNCMNECLANLNMRLCGCVFHFSPKRFGNETICSLYNDECINRLDDYQSNNNNKQCDEMCLPSCSDFKYHTDAFSTPLCNAKFDMHNKILKNFTDEYIRHNIVKLTIYHTDISYRSNVQTELIDMTDVLSGVGGLIGLFFGFSFISVAEIIFYTFIRPCRESLIGLNNEKSMNFKSSSAKRIKTSKVLQYSKRKSFKNSTLFRVSPKIITISQAYNNPESINVHHNTKSIGEKWFYN